MNHSAISTDGPLRAEEVDGLIARGTIPEELRAWAVGRTIEELVYKKRGIVSPKAAMVDSRKVEDLLLRADFRQFCARAGINPRDHAEGWVRRYPSVRWSAQ